MIGSRREVFCELGRTKPDVVVAALKHGHAFPRRSKRKARRELDRIGRLELGGVIAGVVQPSLERIADLDEAWQSATCFGNALEAAENANVVVIEVVVAAIVSA